ncbi:MAG TPA: ATP-binding protein [Dehalococcoidia bacterium]
MTDLQLAPEQLRRRCDPAQLPFKTTEEVPPLDGTIGQERALDAIRFGLEIESTGYNIFATGPSGTGKRSTLRIYLEKHAAQQPTPGDWVYLFNFAEEERPLAVSLPTGRGKRLARDLSQFVESARAEISRAFQSDEYQRRLRETVGQVEQAREQALRELQEHARQRGIGLDVTPAGVVTVPLVNGQPVGREEFERLPQEVQERFREETRGLEQHMAEIMTRMRTLEQEARGRVQALDREVALFAVGHLIQRLKEAYADVPRLEGWLDQVREDVMEHLDQFRASEAEEPQAPGGPAAAAAARRAREEFFGRYQANVFVSHQRNHGAPVVVESNPTYYNLFGRIEYRTAFGAVTTDHRYIRPGAIHRANGGYLMLEAVDVLSNPFVWEKLKQALRTRCIQMENIGSQLTLFPTTTLDPEPMDLDLKVILVGPAHVYQLLYAADEDMRKLFKVRADFTVEMPWAEEQVAQYAAFISRQVRQDRLRHFDAGAVARVVEHGARVLEHQGKLSTRFIDIVDLVSEASYWAGRAGSGVVRAEHVDRALQEKVYRSNLVEEKVRELIAEGTLLIDTDGEAAGQVNGLAVASVGDYAFGRPNRITASVTVGNGDMVSIDRETRLSGPIHNKGFLILSGFLQSRYGRERPLSLRASLVFEQSYEEIEGDSASSAELYALLSALAEAPVRQGIAVTGSVNQHGEIQPIGGVNEKVEGFYRVCKVKGLTGGQGVVIPQANAKNLMLDEEVVQAVRDGRFHVWAVRTVDEGLEVLTGVPAGSRGPDGTYPEGTLHRRIEERLGRLAEAARRYQLPPDGAAPGRRPAAERQERG